MESFFFLFLTAHAVMRKWVLLTDPDDKMAGVKVRKKCLVYMQLYVVVQFYPWFKFYFPLFWGMVMYDNEFKTKKNKI